MEVTKEFLNEMFEYSENSPSGLIRRLPVYRGSEKSGNLSIQQYPGSVVGHRRFRKDGSPAGWFMKLNGSTTGVHRVVYQIFHGVILKSEVVDHIDRNPFNNTIQNLMVTTQLINCRNRKKSKLNTSGVTGVYFESHLGLDYFIAVWNEGGHQQRMRFSVNNLGYDNARQLAVNFREEQIQKLNLNGFGYTPHHGQ